MSKHEANEIVRHAERARRSGRALKVALPTAAILGAGAAIAVGSIPGSDGVITGCYASPAPNVDGFRGNITINGVTEPPGALRVLDPTATGPAGVPDVADECRTGKGEEETKVTWNQQGPTGPTGPQGPTGASGPAGTPGSQGPTGQSGGGETGFGIGNPAGLTFLKLDGISGAVTDKQHKDDIEISSFSFGVSNAGTQSSGGGGGAGAGKVSFQSFKIVKNVDKSSPLLLQALSTGKHIKLAELIFARKAGGTQRDYLYLKLDNVMVSSYQTGGSSKGLQQEQVTFSFQKMQETYLNSNGKPGATVNFDLTTSNKV
jgi:type VI secretion system secreted protein Hcp